MEIGVHIHCRLEFILWNILEFRLWKLEFIYEMNWNVKFKIGNLQKSTSQVRELHIYFTSCICLGTSVTWPKARIFKNLNLRRKADRNFRGTFLKNRFRHLKLYSNPPSWLARSRCDMGTYWNTKDWSSHFWGSQPFRFWYMEFHRQRRLKSTKTGTSP